MSLRRHGATAAALAAAALGVTAIAGATTTVKLTTKVTAKKGTAAKPTSATAEWVNNVGDTSGGRPRAVISWTWSWTGITQSGAGFPTCTAAQIDAAQSDKGCPKGSLIGRSSDFEAELGPSNDNMSNFTCKGKQLLRYNAGAGKIAWLLVGPAGGCGGIAYVPPFTGTLKTKGGTTTESVVFPANISHPLPGVEGNLTVADMHFLSPTRKKGGATIAFMQNTGCKGKRTLSFVTKDDGGTTKSTAPAGSC